MNDNLKTINLFWIIFMGRVEADAGMSAAIQALMSKPVVSDTIQRARAARPAPDTKKRKPKKGDKI